MIHFQTKLFYLQRTGRDWDQSQKPVKTVTSLLSGIHSDIAFKPLNLKQEPVSSLSDPKIACLGQSFDLNVLNSTFYSLSEMETTHTSLVNQSRTFFMCPEIYSFLGFFFLSQNFAFMFFIK